MRSTECWQVAVWFRQKPKPTDKTVIPADLGGVRVKPAPRARRLSLRVDVRMGDVVLCWPLKSRISAEKALRFIAENQGWIDIQRNRAIQRKPFGAGDIVPVAGVDHVIEHRLGRGVTRLEQGRLIVHGRPEHMSRRVRDFLKEEAERVLQELSNEKATQIDLPPVAVRILDPKSRWGSCGPDGKIMYSWRLLLAPYEVMDYVVAHEVAHRVHMNHSKRFWTLCAELSEGDYRACRRWLRSHARLLQSYG
ncbi:MAG: M48 family metallopeptidase [Alphaproteobacteria bacterium]